MTTYYKATFSNGQTFARSTAGRKYSHCWMIDISRKDGFFRRCGFSGSEVLANKAMDGWKAHVRREEIVASFAEVAPATEITAQEYRAIKKVATLPMLAALLPKVG